MASYLRRVKLAIMAVCLCFQAGLALAGTPGGLPLPDQLIALDHPDGQSMFLRTPYNQSFWPLSRWFQTQESPAFCGIATAVMVLNSLKVPLPVADDDTAPAMFTQTNVFNDKVRAVTTPALIATKGLDLDQLARVFKAYPVKVQTHHAHPGGWLSFVRDAKKALQDQRAFVVVNYLRSAIGQKTNGHFSPLGAYDEARDRFLIMDVARYKYPPVWVRAQDLYAAMNTFDAEAGQRRGYLIITSDQ